MLQALTYYILICPFSGNPPAVTAVPLPSHAFRHLQGRLLLERINEPAGAGIVSSRLLVVIKLSLDLLGQRLAKLNTPLVEAVDVPDGTLGEGKVLIVDNQGTQGSRCDLVCQDRSSWAVTKERLVGDKLFWCSFSLDLIWCLADHEGLGLGEEVGSKHLLVLVVVNGVVALGSQDEVGWDKLRALVKELVERVLCVGGGFTKQNGAGGILDVVTAAGDGFSI